jgi:hypothetical protein
LVRRKQGRDVAVVAAQKLHDPAVLDLAEAQPAVLGRDLHPERAQPLQPVHDLGRVLAGGVDRAGTNVVAQEALQSLIERGELRALRHGVGDRPDEVHLEIPEEDLLEERGCRPLGLSRGLRNPKGLSLAIAVDHQRLSATGPP